MPSEKLTNCPLCKSGLFLNHSEIKDHSVSKETFYLCKCTQCGMVFTNPRPDQESSAKYYQSPDYISHQNKATNPVNLLYKLVRKMTVRRKVKILNSFIPKKGSLLDVGCGTGHLLQGAKSNGWKVQGIEPSDVARKSASTSGLKVQKTLGEVKKGKTFEAITLFHVLEHIHDLRNTVKSLIKHLDTKGFLFIAVPNHQSFDANHYKQWWAAWDVPRHLYHFRPDVIGKLADEFDLELVDSHPMVFDSYYVSILSEKYQHPANSGISHFINGTISGYKSNKWAKENQNQYSSILFILKKK